MFRIPAMSLLLFANSAWAGIDQPDPDKVPNPRDFGEIRREVETLRGKNFRRPVPVFKINAKELRAIASREIDKEYPGAKLAGYEELLEWLDMVPAHTDLKAVYGKFLAEEVAGLYDSDSKEMCIPATVNPPLSTRKAADKKPGEFTAQMDDIVLAHEFTHALEDQYWPMDDPADDDTKISTDRGAAHGFTVEGSATREMIEVIPAQWKGDSPRAYFMLWNLIHSAAGEFAINLALSQAWKSDDARVGGVPESLTRQESMPYSYGYTFCAKIMRDWGLDGLDYIYEHPPVSSEQVMHPQKAWEWRDFPAQIDLPESLAGGWKQTSLDSLGEAGMAVLFGCQFKNLGRGLNVAGGWDGDHAALFQGPNGHRLLLWASSWDSTNAAGRFLSACQGERRSARQAVIKAAGNHAGWERPDGRGGFIVRDGNRVILIETDDRPLLQNAPSLARQVSFHEPPEDAQRAAINNLFYRFNPLLERRKDGDYVVTRALGGLLFRHDRNSVGAADSLLMGLLAESRRTASLNKWELGGGFVASHESEGRRGTTKTTWLPWGLLMSRNSARLPQSPDKIISHTSYLWGLGASRDMDGSVNTFEALPFGLLFRSAKGPSHSSIHVLGTGRSVSGEPGNGARTVRYRLLGIPVWTKTSKPTPN